MLTRLVVATFALLLLGTGVVLARALVEQADTAAPVPSPTTSAAVTEAPAQTTTPPSPSVTETVTEPPVASPPADMAAPAPAPATADGRISRRLGRLLAREQVSGDVGIAVLDDQGQPVFGSSAARPLLPASTQKLPVAAAALARLGPDFRFVTTIRGTALPDANGVLNGDLVIVGGGDPTLVGPDYARLNPDRPSTPMRALARRIKRAGITRVTGRIVGDPTIFADEPVAAGWLSRYFDALDATRISGLTVDKGRRLYRSGGGLRAVPAEDPAKEAARSLRKLLKDQGVKVGGGAVAVRQSLPTALEITKLQSPPLDELLQYMVQRSDNHLADTIFRTLGAVDGDSTWIGAAGVVSSTLAPLELDWSGVVLADGSGLSRANRVSAQFLADLQSRMWRSNLQAQWHPLLAVSAHNGTLRYRFRDTVAAGRVYGKTGSLRDVVALTGTLVGPAGRHLHFTMTGNRLRSTSQMRELTDRAVLVLAEELYGCRKVRPPAKTGKNGKPKKRPPARLVCAADDR